MTGRTRCGHGVCPGPRTFFHYGKWKKYLATAPQNLALGLSASSAMPSHTCPWDWTINSDVALPYREALPTPEVQSAMNILIHGNQYGQK